MSTGVGLRPCMSSSNPLPSAMSGVGDDTWRAAAEALLPAGGSECIQPISKGIWVSKASVFLPVHTCTLDHARALAVHVDMFRVGRDTVLS